HRLQKHHAPHQEGGEDPAGGSARTHRVRLPVRGEEDLAVNHPCFRMTLERLDLESQVARKPYIVIVEKSDKRPPAHRPTSIPRPCYVPALCEPDLSGTGV